MNRLVFAVACLTIVSVAKADADLQAAADDVCDCLEAPYAQVEQAMEMMSAAQASGDMSELMAAQGEMMAVIDASSACFAKLPEKYPEINESPELQDQVMAMANEQCPNPAQSMSPGQ